jgi:universal stress protein E
MKSIKSVLVVLGDDAESNRAVLRKAAVLARAAAARLTAVRVVYEGIGDSLPAAFAAAAPELKTAVLTAEESATEDLLADFAAAEGADLPAIASFTLWNRRVAEGVLHAAARVEADVIIKAATRPAGLEQVIRTPDDWNLLRSAGVPVLLAEPRPWPSAPPVLCALDVFDAAHDDLNRRLLRIGDLLARLLGGTLEVVVAYPLFERWVGEIGGLRDYEGVRNEVERDIRARVVNLAASAGVDYHHLYADEGRAEQVIGRLADSLPAALVLVGTHARKGVTGFVIGNTSERLLHHLDSDVMTLPAAG